MSGMPRACSQWCSTLRPSLARGCSLAAGAGMFVCTVMCWLKRLMADPSLVGPVFEVGAAAGARCAVTPQPHCWQQLVLWAVRLACRIFVFWLAHFWNKVHFKRKDWRLKTAYYIKMEYFIPHVFYVRTCSEVVSVFLCAWRFFSPTFSPPIPALSLLPCFPLSAMGSAGWAAAG